jgi:hypothetical protein
MSTSVAESMRIHEVYSVEGGSCSVPALDAGRTLLGKCLPRMFSIDADVLEGRLEAFTIPVANVGMPASEGGAAASCRELPPSVFTYEEMYGPRPDTLPPGFHMRQTPVEIANCVRINKKGRQCKLLYNPNLYALVMGPGHRPIFGRYIRQLSSAAAGTNAHQWIYLECIFFAYSITFHVSMLNAPGVQFYPAFVPTPASDLNFWARSVTDYVGPMNTVPPVPPGTFVTFGRLPGPLSVRQTKSGKDYVLTSKFGQVHPIVDGKCLFPPMEDEGAPMSDPSYQDGGVAYVVHRMNPVEMGFQDESVQPGQPVILYARLAFGNQALESIDDQRTAIFRAVRYALYNSPRDADGRQFVQLDTSHDGQAAADFGTCFVYDTEEFGEKVVAGCVNAVDIGQQALLLLARWILKDNAQASFQEALREAKFHTAFVASGADGDGAATDVVVDGFVRTYDATDYGPITELVTAAKNMARSWYALSDVAPAIYYMAPPDKAAFGEKPVVVIGFIVHVQLGVERTSPANSHTPPEMYDMYKTVSDVATRFMWDMMFYNSQLSVVSTRKETLLSLFTEKAPGMLNVWSGKTGLPSRTTSTSQSRRIKNPHEALYSKTEPFVVETSDVPLKEPECQQVLPALDRAAANANPLLRMMIRGPALPSEVPGTEVSVYRAGSKGGMTEWAGTCHAWITQGGLVWHKIMKAQTVENPWGFFGPEVSKEEREAAVDLLYAPFYNSVKGQNWKLDGYWKSPDFRRREWETAYGVSVADMHRAMGYLMYPAFANEHAAPTTMRIWQLKQRCEAVLHFMSRYGRIVRGVLQNRRRRVRQDVPFVIRNYISQVGQRVPGAPIANLFLSGYNAFSKCLILGGDVHAATKAVVAPVDVCDGSIGTMIGAPPSAPVIIQQEITTSVIHNCIMVGNDADLFLDNGGMDDEDGEEELFDLPEVEGGFGAAFPESLGFSLQSIRSVSNYRSVIGSVRSCGPGTLEIMRELQAAFDAPCETEIDAPEHAAAAKKPRL